MRGVYAALLIVTGVLYAIAQATVHSPEEDGVVHLRWYTDPNPARQEQIKEFEKLYPGIRVTVDPLVGDDDMKLLVQYATGVGPDVVQLNAEEMIDLSQGGLLMDLTPYAAEMGFNVESTWPSIREDLQWEEKQYRYPCNLWANCIIYNKTIFDDHGVPYPTPEWTYEDLIRISQAIRDNPSKSGKTHVPVANPIRVWTFQDILVQHHVRLFSDDGLTSQLDSPEAIAAMQLYSDLMHTHRVLATPTESTSMGGQGGWGYGELNLFCEGRIAMVIIARWVAIQIPNYPAIREPGAIGVVTLPRLGDQPSTGMCGARGAGISATSHQKEAALKFMQYLSTPQYNHIIIRDGDSMPPNPDLAQSGEDLVTPFIGDPAFHQPFVDALNNARTLDWSPFINGGQLYRWLMECIEKVENRIITPEEAMRGMAKEVNETIRQNIERQPELQKKFEEITGREWTPD